jgi:hypothetical protein
MGLGHGIGGSAFARSLEESLLDVLDRAGVEWAQLPDREWVNAEAAWRWVYGQAFRGRPRLRRMGRAEQEFQSQVCNHYLIVPFSAGVPGLPVHVHRRAVAAYECRGPLIALGAFCDAEFFISPPDLTWTMIHTHEDHALDGPYFLRDDWIPRGPTRRVFGQNDRRPG